AKGGRGEAPGWGGRGGGSASARGASPGRAARPAAVAGRPESAQELLVARDGARRRPVLLGVLGHDGAGVEGAVVADLAFHHRSAPLAEEVRGDSAVVDRDGGLAVGQQEALLVRGRVLLE